MSVITAKTFPLDENGKFKSEPAECAFQVAAKYGLTRVDTREIIQAFVAKDDECQKRYDEWVAAGRPR